MYNQYNQYRYPTPNRSIAPPPHPQDFGINVPLQYSKVNRKFKIPIDPYLALEYDLLLIYFNLS